MFFSELIPIFVFRSDVIRHTQQQIRKNYYFVLRCTFHLQDNQYNTLINTSMKYTYTKFVERFNIAKYSFSGLNKNQRYVEAYC